MSGIAFNESLILEFDKPITDREVLSAMTDYLCEKGIVKDTYKQAILEREQSFPTGLRPGESTWPFLMRISAMLMRLPSAWRCLRHRLPSGHG